MCAEEKIFETQKRTVITEYSIFFNENLGKTFFSWKKSPRFHTRSPFTQFLEKKKHFFNSKLTFLIQQIISSSKKIIILRRNTRIFKFDIDDFSKV